MNGYDEDTGVREPLTQGRIEELRASVPHATVETMFTIESGDEAAIEAIREYLKAFADPVKKESANMMTGGQLCLACGAALDGFLGTFKWGLAHGEGFCERCGWPCRAYHFIKDAAGEDVATIRGLVLQYHPDGIEVRDAAVHPSAAESP